MEKVYEALYSPSTWEGTPMTLSIHKTLQGAEKAIKENKERWLKKWQDQVKDCKELDMEPPYPTFEEYIEDRWWGINETELKE